ncbi:MAG: GMC family oxidoreductase N-terminal domain-containing protein [Magnetospirillum sp.]|nr:GMC family oxidoreductase N-terminal domain-containing protein [Magnetospirillum sp.]
MGMSVPGTRADYLIVGGGSAGCVLASRLSEDPCRRVCLVEAGPDFDAQARADLTDTYGGRAFVDPQYFWPNLRARHAQGGDDAAYKQGMLLGGGSSINGQIALRGAPADYEHWHESGAAGWNWTAVLPYFRKLETDLDFGGDLHGTTGPIAIKRTHSATWDSVTAAYARAWSRLGFAHIPDLNGEFGDGYGPLPFSNDGTTRHSASRAYLGADVRARANLAILTQTRVLRVVTENGRAVGVEAMRDGEPVRLDAERVILAAGALRTPQILMLSGIGDGNALGRHGIATIAHRPGVGKNLQDHPIVSISAYTEPTGRTVPPSRAVTAYLRYSSQVAGCEPSDMVLSGGARAMWHAVGARICALRAYIALPYSRGSVALRSGDPHVAPAIDFNGMSDPRDVRRIVGGFRLVATVLSDHLRPETVSDVFPARLSQRIEGLSRPILRNELLSRIGALAMDSSKPLRRFLIRRVITNGESLTDILQNDRTIEDYVRSTLGTSWHASGTCRMGARNDDASVVDSSGAVIGARNLFVADASIMPRITRTNTNLPTLMLAERLADLIPKAAA